MNTGDKMQEHRIQELKAKLLESAALVQQMLSLAMIQLNPKESSSFDEVMALEARVNELELKNDTLAINLIALFQPEAKDLRRIMMMFRINSDLERLGDQAVNIAESARHLQSYELDFPDIWQMQEATMEMLTNSITAFLNEDTDAATAVCANDNIIDAFNRAIYDRVLTGIKGDSAHAERYLHVLRIAKNLERIGDLATNIAENTVYLALGRVIKHNQEL